MLASAQHSARSIQAQDLSPASSVQTMDISMGSDMEDEIMENLEDWESDHDGTPPLLSEEFMQKFRGSDLRSSLGLSNVAHMQPLRNKERDLHTLLQKYQTSKRTVVDLRAEVDRLKETLTIFTKQQASAASPSQHGHYISLPTPMLLDTPLPTGTPTSSSSILPSFQTAPVAIPTSRPALQQRKREDHPKIRYWHKHEWTAVHQDLKDSGDAKSGAKGRVRQAQGVNVMLRYVENEDGTVVDGYVAKQIRELARRIWQSFADNNMHPTTWGRASQAVMAGYREEMERAFPLLALCDNHWKVDNIATESYPSWYAGRFKIKQEHDPIQTFPTASSTSNGSVPTITGEKRVASEPPPMGSIIKRSRIKVKNPLALTTDSNAVDALRLKNTAVAQVGSTTQLTLATDLQASQLPAIALANPIPCITPAPMPQLHSPLPPSPLAMESSQGVLVAFPGVSSAPPSTATDPGSSTSSGPPPTTARTSPAPSTSTSTSTPSIIPIDAPERTTPLPPCASDSVPSAQSTAFSSTPTPRPNTAAASTTSAYSPTTLVSSIPPAIQDTPILPTQMDLPQPASTSPEDGKKMSSTGAKKFAKMRPTASTTARGRAKYFDRNLCAVEWCSKHPEGTTQDFKDYYDNLSSEEKKDWEAQSTAKRKK
ncbi:hypothetical protein H0H92_000962 [Tricholoma furcatifolium]|nr:hypothetical protein H0H92_000962 [Tricholoma furcatifolium]